MKSNNNYYFLGYLIVLIGVLLLFRRFLIWGGLGAYIVIACLLAAAVAFARSYLLNDRKWWAIIPAGAALTIAVVLLLRTMGVLPYGLKNIILYLGFALPFWSLWVERRQDPSFKWTIYPAMLLTIGSALSYSSYKEWISDDYFIALLILLTGALLLLRSWNRSR